MNRRSFIRKASLATAGTLALPYILPSGSLFAKTGARRVNKVVFCFFAGGVRVLDSVQKAEGNLMPCTFYGNEAISGSIAHSMTPLPNSPLSQPLQAYGTLYKQFVLRQGATGHFPGHVTGLTGRYTDNSLNYRGHPPYPTVFEYYLKHNSPQKTPLNAWWISNSMGAFSLMNYSAHPDYGTAYAANHLSPGNLINRQQSALIGNTIERMHERELKINQMREVLNKNFNRNDLVRPGLMQNDDDRQKLQLFLNDIYGRFDRGELWNPWGIGAGYDWDSMAVFYAEELMRRFQPELTVVNLQGVDVCHTNFTGYCDAMRRNDYAIAHLWHTIQTTPGMMDDTVMIITSEHGRNAEPNTIIDSNGRRAIDHTDDDMARRIFCLIVGPPHVIKQNQVIEDAGRDGGRKAFELTDVVPTIAHVLGFDTAIGGGILTGSPLYEAFV